MESAVHTFARLKQTVKPDWKALYLGVFMGLFGGFACSSRPSLNSNSVAVESPYPVWVRSTENTNSANQESRKYGAGEKFYWSQNESLWVEAPGRAAVLLTPITKETQSLKLDLPTQRDWQDKTVQAQVSQVLWNVMPKLKLVEQLFAARKYGEALPLVVEMKSLYPHLEYLRWVEASCLWNMGQRDAAKVIFAELKESSVYYTKPIDLWNPEDGAKRSPSSTQGGQTK